MKQLFDDDDGSEHCDVPDKQCLRNIHNDGCSKLNQILYSSDELCLSNLSEQLSSCEYHKAMCKILEGFFKGINNLLPPPKIIKVTEPHNVSDCSIVNLYHINFTLDHSRFSGSHLN